MENKRITFEEVEKTLGEQLQCRAYVLFSFRYLVHPKGRGQMQGKVKTAPVGEAITNV